MADAYLLSRMKVRLTRNRPSRIEAIEIALGRIFTRVVRPAGELEYTGARAANHARPQRPPGADSRGGRTRSRSWTTAARSSCSSTRPPISGARSSQQAARDDELLNLARAFV